MQTTEAVKLFDYLYWARDAVLRAAAELSRYYVMHLVSHGIQQLSEAAVLLTRANHSPGDIGFLEFARHHSGHGQASRSQDVW